MNLNFTDDVDFFTIKNNHNILFIAFGGVAHGLGMNNTPFEFVNSLSKKGCDVMFIKDSNQAWYQFGINGIGNTIEKTSKKISKYASNYERVVTIGNSMGGYASILFGALINSDISIAFDPQTFIDRENRIRYADNRWDKEMNRIYQKVKFSKFFDLKKLFETENCLKKTHCYLFYSGDDDLDKIHSSRMEKIKSIEVFGIKDARHNVSRKIRDVGLLDIIIERIISKKPLSIKNLME